MPFFRTLLALVVCVSAVGAGELKTLKGKTVTGDLARVDSKEVVLAKGEERVSTPTEQVLTVDVAPLVRIPPGNNYLQVELIDGSVLLCSAVGIKGNNVELTTLLTGQKVKLPLAAIANLLSNAQDAKFRKDWADRLKERNKKIPKVTRDGLAIVREEVINVLDGTLGESTEEGKIAFTLASNGKKRDMPLENIHGLIFWRQPIPNQAPTICKLLDSYDNLVMVSAATTSDTGLTVTTPAGAKLDYTFQQLSRLDYSKGKLTYLSDMVPTRLIKDDKDKEGIVFFEKDRTPNDDRFSAGIKMNNVTYPKGLFIQATTEVEYDLGGDYVEFRAMVGLDDYDKRSEDCPTLLIIEGDGRPLYEQKVNPKKGPRVQPLTLSIKDMQKLKIIVKSGGGFSTVARQVTLGDAKVSK